MESAIMAALAVILQITSVVLPTLNAATSSPVIASIIIALEKWVPLVTALFPSATMLYKSIKNIIASLSANPDTTAQQLLTLQQLDAQVDTAFEAAAKDVDPDATPAAP
jgi:hypothetical protein